MLHLYHKVQSTLSPFQDIIFPLKTFYQPLIFENQTGSEQNTDTFQNQKLFQTILLLITLLAVMPKLPYLSHKLTI